MAGHHVARATLGQVVCRTPTAARMSASMAARVQLHHVLMAWRTVVRAVSTVGALHAHHVLPASRAPSTLTVCPTCAACLACVLPQRATTESTTVQSPTLTAAAPRVSPAVWRAPVVRPPTVVPRCVSTAPVPLPVAAMVSTMVWRPARTVAGVSAVPVRLTPPVSTAAIVHLGCAMAAVALGRRASMQQPTVTRRMLTVEDRAARVMMAVPVTPAPIAAHSCAAAAPV